MSRSDGGLARVSYLPGVQPPSDHAAAPEPAAPTFRSLYGDDDSASDLADASDISATGETADEAAERELEEADAAAERDPERQAARAENVSMHALTRRGQSRRELERTLRSRDIDDDIIAAEIERLERVGLVDDLALAQNLVGVLQERKGLGRSGIAAELTRRLLSPAAIEYALELIDSGDELARAREIAVKRAGQLRSYDQATATRRLSAFLARRGYSGSTVRSAVDYAMQSRGSSSTVRFR